MVLCYGSPSKHTAPMKSSNRLIRNDYFIYKKACHLFPCRLAFLKFWDTSLFHIPLASPWVLLIYGAPLISSCHTVSFVYCFLIHSSKAKNSSFTLEFTQNHLVDTSQRYYFELIIRFLQINTLVCLCIVLFHLLQQESLFFFYNLKNTKLKMQNNLKLILLMLPIYNSIFPLFLPLHIPPDLLLEAPSPFGYSPGIWHTSKD